MPFPDTDFGPMVQVMVGALLVSGVETVWSGEEIPAYADAITRKDHRGRGIVLERFAEMARFNYGSTVIVLLPKGAATLAASLVAGGLVRWGRPDCVTGRPAAEAAQFDSAAALQFDAILPGLGPRTSAP